MDHSVGFRDELIHAHTCFMEGSVPRPSSIHVATVMLSSVRGQVPRGDSWELTCLSLSLLGNVSCGLMSRRGSADALFSWGETLRLLLEDMDVVTQLMLLFRAEDRVISHLAAKTASVCVFYHLHTSGKLHPVWQEKCVQTFHSSPPGAELDACLWSLTDLSKKLLKGSHQEFLGRLVGAFESSVRALFERLLRGEAEELTQCWEQHWGTTFCLLLDLLEVLTASGLMCGGAVGLTSHRIAQTHLSVLLTAVSCSPQYFVKKRTLLVLRRTLCQRAGEDWSVGPASSTRLERDMAGLATCVLTAVDDNWLQTVTVEAAPFFGGTRHLRGGEGHRADEVMLRAVSLLLLKSIDLHIQTEGAVCRHLQRLWSFLRQHSPLLTNVAHRCSWISLLFADQDDDLMEAARTSLCIFLRHRRCSHSDTHEVLKAACASGYNPHCHFVLLLQSISFDHSILLDFLISSETCFLEYLVQYLRYLREDWQGFTAACGGAVHCSLSLPHADPPVGGSVSAAGLRLVAYDSSDESGDSEAEASSDMKQEADGASTARQHESSAAPPSEASSTCERVPESWSLPLTHKHVAPAFRQETCGALERAVLCLSELRDVMTRLQKKKLFPYNPSSLLKLLVQVLNCYQRSRP